MISKPKTEVAREHLSKAQDEAAAGDLRDAVQWSFADLHRLLNEERKAMFYEGEDPELGDLSIEDVLADIETAVGIAEAEAA